MRSAPRRMPINHARPHPPFGLTRAERAYFDAAGSRMPPPRDECTPQRIDVADAGDDEAEEEEEEEEDRARDACGRAVVRMVGNDGRDHAARRSRRRRASRCAASARWRWRSSRRRRYAAGVASSLGLRIPRSPRISGCLAANRRRRWRRSSPRSARTTTRTRTGRVDRSERRRRPPGTEGASELPGGLRTTSAGFGDQPKRLKARTRSEGQELTVQDARRAGGTPPPGMISEGARPRAAGSPITDVTDVRGVVHAPRRHRSSGGRPGASCAVSLSRKGDRRNLMGTGHLRVLGFEY